MAWLFWRVEEYPMNIGWKNSYIKNQASVLVTGPSVPRQGGQTQRLTEKARTNDPKRSSVLLARTIASTMENL